MPYLLRHKRLSRILRALQCGKLALALTFLSLFPTISQAEWTMIWNDEFDGDGPIDQTKWNFESFEPGANNNELQKYTHNRIENCRRQNGILILEGRRDWWYDAGNGNTYEYTSARIQTAGKFNTKYGKIEMRAQLPWANGAWPAFWMMPQHSLYGGWPDSGEIDIMEYVGWDNDIAHVNAHTKDRNFLLGTNYGWSGWVANQETAYHTYTVEWWYDRMDFYIDGIWRYGFTNEDTGWGDWPFNSEFFIILNHAIGGDWGGLQGIDTGAYDVAGDNFGVGYFVDWVRAYKWDWPDHDIPAHVEAEHYEDYNGDIREQKCTDVGGGWNVGFIDDVEYMQYKFNIPASGWYQVDYRVASDTGGGILTLGRGGTDIRQTPVPDTGGWQNWITLSEVVWLEAGSQTLDIYATIGGWNINHFKIHAAPPATHIEAEYYSSMSGMMEENSEDTGGGISLGYVSSGDWVNFPVDIPVSGPYEISYRTASQDGGGTITLGKNGTDIQQTAAPNTGGWKNWATITDTADLEKGQQTLTLFATTGGWNLNWWRYELIDPAFSTWADHHNIVGSGRTGNDDHDPRPNEYEFLFGLNPNSAIENPDRIPHVEVHTSLPGGETYPAFTFTKRLHPDDATYTVESSTSLNDWTPCLRDDDGTAPHTYTQLSSSPDHGDGSHTITIRYNQSFDEMTSGNLYFRLFAEE
ncbi:MAG: carbohydrate-binding protein [Verrucomicrobiota bacterium]